MDRLNKVDHSAIRTNQALIVGLTLVAFIINIPLLVTLVGLVMLSGSILARPGFLPVYKGVLLRFGWVKPDVVPDNPEPHRFAQSMGSAFLLGASLAFLAGGWGLGWVLAWIVILLASLNLFAGFCAGCFVYYWLRRLNVPGFTQSPPPNTFPGMRPKVS